MIRVLIAAAVLVGIAGMLPVPAMAQQETGSRLGAPRAQIPDHPDPQIRLRLIYQAFAKCITDLKPGSAKRFVDTIPLTREADKRLAYMNVPQCLMAGDFTFYDPPMRGATYERLIQREFRKPDLSAVATVAAPLPEIDASHTRGLAQIALRQFGDCLVLRDPAKAMALFDTEIGTDAERLHVNAMQPAMSECLTQGSKITLNVEVLRSIVAERLYRRLQAASAAG